MRQEEKIIHNSHDLWYRRPFGAVEADTGITLRLSVDISDCPSSVWIRFWQEGVGETQLRMMLESEEGTNKNYVVRFNAPSEGRLVWYYFIIKSERGMLFYGNNEKMQGGIGKIYTEVPPSYQITVYDHGAATPDWMKNGVMYQIFPDRFYRDKAVELPEKKNAVYHASWKDEPYYFKDPDTREIIAYDFFGGNLSGIIKKLPYLKELGISIIYLNPIFRAASNHRYDTGDYFQIDPVLGTNEDLHKLCVQAEKLNMRIILDGVFSHNGSDSRYFNREGSYDSVGAYQSKESPYYKWYDFINYPNQYQSWWGFDTLPNVHETEPSYLDFIIRDKKSVLKYWLEQGISGWRLDVIDELPAEFSQLFFKEMKKVKPDAALIGEVWEDASNKVSYGAPREYLCGHEMDSAMNYPFRKILLDFVTGAVGAGATKDALLSLCENYPQENLYAMMNLVGSHDVERVLTLLGDSPLMQNEPDVRKAEYRMSADKLALAVSRLKMVSLWQMTFPGMPTVYYGDEAGMQGHRDPYNRRPFCWGSENTELTAWYKKIISLRNRIPALRTGTLELKSFNNDDVAGFVRRIAGGKDCFGSTAEDDAWLIVFNRSAKVQSIRVGEVFSGQVEEIIQIENKHYQTENGILKIEISPLSGAVFHQITNHKFSRSAGILMHPTSLPDEYGYGSLGSNAIQFVDFLAAAKQSYWQVLPLGPVLQGDSPYQSPSAFAGNPAMISLERLVDDGLLKKTDIQLSFTESVAELAAHKLKILRRAWKNFKKDTVYQQFCQKAAGWLDDYSLFAAIKTIYPQEWMKWPTELAHRKPEALQKIRQKLRSEIEFQSFVQFTFFIQWQAVHNYAQIKNIKIIGDAPIFMAQDSADVWANQSQFKLDAKTGRPQKVAGVPPDYFSETGQLWGNPHYNWEVMRKDGYGWWKSRLHWLLTLVDVVRIDHFRGLEAYWEVDGAAETAINGCWRKGPGFAFMKEIKQEFGELPFIAEDLGVITPLVNDLKNGFMLPGMKIMQFALPLHDKETNNFSCEQNCVIYTGTHDNNTLLGWLKEELNDSEISCLQTIAGEYGNRPELICSKLIEQTYAANADLAIVPLQDLKGMDSNARMNLPGTVGGRNWHWQLKSPVRDNIMEKKLSQLMIKYGRNNNK